MFYEAYLPDFILSRIPIAKGVQGQLGYWISPDELEHKIHTLFPGSMKGNFWRFTFNMLLNDFGTNKTCKDQNNIVRQELRSEF
jgi:hypothetical protein